MARPREFDEAQVLEAAMEAFWDRGYESISMEDLTAATGLSRSSIYAAYESKRGLFAAALNFYMTTRVGSMLGDLEGPEADLDTVLAFFGMLESVSVEYADRYALGCFLTNTMTELGRSDAAIRDIGTLYFDRLRGAFSNAVRSSSTSDDDADARGQLLATLALGSFVVARGAEVGRTNGPALVGSLVEGWR